MPFNSFSYLLIFLPVVCGGFWILRSRKVSNHWMLIWLCACSLFFSLQVGVPAVLALLASIIVQWVLLRRIAVSGARMRRAWLVIGLILAIGLLALVKYIDFLVPTVGAVITPWRRMLVPLGISFITFQQIAWLVDLFRGTITSAPAFMPYLAHITFFPSIAAGPISRPGELTDQLFLLRKRVSAREACVGFFLILLGTAQKVLIADTLISLTVPVAEAAGRGVHLSVLEAWGTTIAYALGLLFDFSGYTDVAIGSALLIGIRLPVNFDAPYRSRSIVEFWRRWHITLSSFIRDYLYIPLGGNRHGRIRQYAALLIAMTLAGLWHGAGWTFVCWGLLHGVLLVINHAWRGVRSRVLSPSSITSGWYAGIARLLTLLCLLGTWPFFFAPSMGAALSIVRSMISVSAIALPRQMASFFGGIAPGFLSFTLQNQLVVTLSQWVSVGAVIVIAVFIAAFVPSTASLFQKWLTLHSDQEPSALPLHPFHAIFFALLTVGTFTMLLLHGSPQFLYFTF